MLYSIEDASQACQAFLGTLNAQSTLQKRSLLRTMRALLYIANRYFI